MDPAANVEGETRYLGELLVRYHHDLSKALAAYNAGPDAWNNITACLPTRRHWPMWLGCSRFQPQERYPAAPAADPSSPPDQNSDATLFDEPDNPN